MGEMVLELLGENIKSMIKNMDENNYLETSRKIYEEIEYIKLQFRCSWNQ